jgi:hypothetical protein
VGINKEDGLAERDKNYPRPGQYAVDKSCWLIDTLKSMSIGASRPVLGKTRLFASRGCLPEFTPLSAVLSRAITNQYSTELLQRQLCSNVTYLQSSLPCCAPEPYMRL